MSFLTAPKCREHWAILLLSLRYSLAGLSRLLSPHPLKLISQEYANKMGGMIMSSKKIVCCLSSSSCLGCTCSQKFLPGLIAKFEHFELELTPCNFQFLSPFLEPGLLCLDHEIPTYHQRLAGVQLLCKSKEYLFKLELGPLEHSRRYGKCWGGTSLAYLSWLL